MCKSPFNFLKMSQNCLFVSLEHSRRHTSNTSSKVKLTDWRKVKCHLYVASS